MGKATVTQPTTMQARDEPEEERRVWPQPTTMQARDEPEEERRR
jgi:hypothetical protein